MFQFPIFCSQLVRHLTVHHFPDPGILLRRLRPSFPVGHLPDPVILRNVVRRFQVVHFQSPKTGEINRVRVAVSVLCDRVVGQKSSYKAVSDFYLTAKQNDIWTHDNHF